MRYMQTFTDIDQQYGVKDYKKIKCEHCGNVMIIQEPLSTKVEDVVCGKCRMTSDKE